MSASWRLIGCRSTLSPPTIRPVTAPLWHSPPTADRAAPREHQLMRLIAQLAAPRAGLARQAGADSVGLRGDRARHRGARTRRDPLPLRGGAARRAQDARRARRPARSRPAARRADRPRLAARLRADLRPRRRRPRRARQLGVQRLGEVRQLAARRASRPARRARSPGCRGSSRARPTTGERVVLEGGSIDVNGAGLLLTTEECLLSDVQVRNPGMTPRGLRAGLRATTSASEKTLWLGEGSSATTRTATSTTSPASSAPRHVVLGRRGATRATTTTRRSMDNLRRLQRADGDAGVGRWTS